MATQAEIDLMLRRKGAAASAIKFFSDKQQVRSSNNPFNLNRGNDHVVLNQYRGARVDDSIREAFDNAARTNVGNCDEKGRICFAALHGNPMLNGNSVVTLVSAMNYDHVFVVVANAAVAGATNVGQLGLTAMIVDGWTEDWYFPNLPWYTAKWNSLGNTPNPRQLYVRVQIEQHQFQQYRAVPLV